MKRIQLLSVLLVAMMFIPLTANAGFRLGPRVGVSVNALKFNSDLFSSVNRAGFTGGLEGEMMLGMIGVDASVLYVHRVQQAHTDTYLPVYSPKDYITVPVNLKVKFPIPLISPYVFTGPEFSFLTSRTDIDKFWSNNRTDVSWNIGFGAEILKHLQISCSYDLGVSKLKNKNYITLPGGSATAINGRNNQWTVTAAWLF